VLAMSVVAAIFFMVVDQIIAWLVQVVLGLGA
jgi:preprotein translocase subunit SecE